MLALLVFLLCAVVGSVVLASASAAAGRVKRLKEDDQAVYTLTSAAKMFSKELDGASCAISYDPDTKTADVTADTGEHRMAGLLAQLTKAEAEQLAGNGTAAAEVKSTVSFSTADLKTVSYDATMNSSYQLKVVFTIDGGTGQQVTLTMDAIPYENISAAAATPYARINASDETKIPLSISWGNPSITVGSAE